MKHLEDLTRLRVNEALQNGIKSQQVHRALSENKEKRTRDGKIEFADASHTNLPLKLFGIVVSSTILLKIIWPFVF